MPCCFSIDPRHAAQVHRFHGSDVVLVQHAHPTSRPDWDVAVYGPICAFKRKRYATSAACWNPAPSPVPGIATRPRGPTRSSSSIATTPGPGTVRGDLHAREKRTERYERRGADANPAWFWSALFCSADLLRRVPAFARCMRLPGTAPQTLRVGWQRRRMIVGNAHAGSCSAKTCDRDRSHHHRS